MNSSNGTTDVVTALAGLRRSAPRSQAVSLAVGIVDGYREYDSPVGTVVVAFNPTGVSSVDLAEGDPEARFRSRFGRDLVKAVPPAGWERLIGNAIERGSPGKLPIDLEGVSGFARSVLSLTAEIPAGQVRPYGWLAREAGKPGAARAVGSTMARNPVPLIIPCHRVVRSDGMIGEYSLGGTERKWTLLDAEGAHPQYLEQLGRRGVRFVASDTTGIFCLPTCSHARRITEAHRIELSSHAAAAGAGFRACLVCRP